MAKFLDKMGQRLSQAASSAKEKSRELLDAAKLNKQISELEISICQLKEEIGEQFYLAYSAGTDPEHLLEKCEQIDALRHELTELRRESDRIRGTIHCQQCGEALDQVLAFCPHCGGKLNAN